MKDEHEFKVGWEYVDKGSPSKEEDQFLSWIKGPLEKGIGMMGGIRKLKSHSPPNEGETTCIVLVSNERRRPSGLDNPWKDSIKLEKGRIKYWGDAKLDEEKDPDDYRGNKLLKDWYLKSQVDNERSKVPPILFFKKPKEPGKVEFCGLVIIKKFETRRYLHNGKPVPNYLFHLDVLDEDEVPLDWIHERTLKGTDENASDSWKKWVNTGEVERYSIWRKSTKKKDEQLPPRDDKRWNVLEKINERFNGREFEFVLKFLLNQSDRFNELEVTQASRDRGYDLTGKASIPELDFQIDFYAECKNKDVNNDRSYIRPKDVSRLASRLGTGTFGIFVTTSWFTSQAQEETTSSYPIKLVPGKKLVDMLLTTDLVKKDGALNEKLMKKIKEEAR